MRQSMGLQRFRTRCENMPQTKGCTYWCTTNTSSGKKSISIIATIKQINHLMGKLKNPRMVRKPCYLMHLPHPVSRHKKDIYIDEQLLLHTKDGFTLKNAVNDYLLPRQIDPPFNSEEDDEEEGVSKKKKKCNETTTISKVVRSFTFSIYSSQPKRPISIVGSLPTSVSGKNVRQFIQHQMNKR